MPLRVIQWATGGVGALALHAILGRRDFALAGVLVTSPEKDGRDAGELAGLAPAGVRATRDVEAILTTDADCVCYAAHGETRLRACVDDLARILASGKNVVTTSLPQLVHPASFDPALRARLEEACRTGGTSAFATGIEPGFAGDLLPSVLCTMSEQVESIRTQELFSWSAYPVASTVFEVFGFGKPVGHKPLLTLPGVQRASWGPAVELVASALGVEVEAFRETYEVYPTPRRLEVAAGAIEAGTVGAIRFETIGVVNGRDAIVIEHVNRMAPDLAPHWPSASRDGVYRVRVEGRPRLACELALGSPEDFSAHGMIATAMRAVNAIPAVCAAPPGLVSSLDLPLTLPRGAFDPS
jgi:hypothetical protein